MKIKFKYVKNKKAVVLHIGHLQNRKQVKICEATPAQWNEEAQMITSAHPQFTSLYPYMNEILIKAYKIKLERINDVNRAMNYLLVEQDKDPELIEWLESYIKKKQLIQDNYERKGELIERNRMAGHVKRYYTVLVKLKQYYKVIPYSNVTKWWVRQLQDQLLEDELLQESTAVGYLSRIKTLYFKMIVDHDLPDSNAFKQPLHKVSTRSFEARKKRLDADSMKKLDTLELSGIKKRARDTFMVLFELGGCDLTDLYFLKKSQVIKGRLYLERSKIRGSDMDLKVTARLEQYIRDYGNKNGNYLFPWRKDVDGYRTWRDNARRDLRKAAKMENITDVTGAAISMKCARHTFASTAKDKGVDGDLLRELMGHRRNDVDNYYKEAYPEKMRDKAQLKVIKI
jgi:site-specific recombinase XerD